MIFWGPIRIIKQLAEIPPKFRRKFWRNGWLAEWVAGSAVKLGIFSNFWRGARRPRQKSKNMLKTIRRNFGRIFHQQIGRNLRQIMIRTFYDTYRSPILVQMKHFNCQRIDANVGIEHQIW